MRVPPVVCFFFFFNDTATTEIYTLSLHDALPISVVITGRAARPSYLVVSETGAELKPAHDLWGRATRDTVQAIVAAEGPEADAIAIGPAGERRVRYAAMAHYWKNREGVSGRGGLGAVLGAKQLKAVVVRGTRKTEVADPA